MKNLIIAIAVMSFSVVAFAEEAAHMDAKPAQTEEHAKTVVKKKKEAAHGKKAAHSEAPKAAEHTEEAAH